MLDFSEEHKAAQKAIRAWCTQRLEPSVDALERNEVQPYPLIRELATTFGIPDLAKARIAKMKEKGEGARMGNDGALSAILFMELSRCFAYLIDSSRQRSTMPRAIGVMPNRS